MDTTILKSLLYFEVISKLDWRIISFLNRGPEEEKILILYFSFLRDGSIRMPLNGLLSSRWDQKWSKLKASKMLEQEDGTYALKASDEKMASEIEELFSDLSLAATSVLKSGVKSPMHIESEYLYTIKNFNAAQSIMSQFKKIFPIVETEVTDNEIDTMIQKYEKSLHLDTLQAKAICMGLKGSIIITGGPGTGKTTVVKYLLDELKARYKDYRVYLAAPSGKASDRLRESIQGLDPKLPDGYESMTIHRLLSYNPGTNDFSYNADNRFNKKSIFVIDEASMIDLELFAKLLEAIPSEARVYLLGDKNQLPSVDAGAVLGDLLASASTKLVIELEKSQRFGYSTAVGRLALSMQKDNNDEIQQIVSEKNWQSFESLSSSIIAGSKEESCLQLFNYQTNNNGRRLTRAQKQEALEKALKAWAEKFCGRTNDVEATKNARILCAEHKGVYGVDNINETLSKIISKQKSDDFFVGKQVMIVKNIEALNLFNGDSGIIAKDSNNTLCFMKSKEELTPLHLIPSECISTAYASTIHKAQGSGYDNVLMLLPENKQSLLATRQILYTGITRVKKGTLYIVGSADRFDACLKNTIIRDTGIDCN